MVLEIPQQQQRTDQFVQILEEGLSVQREVLGVDDALCDPIWVWIADLVGGRGNLGRSLAARTKRKVGHYVRRNRQYHSEHAIFVFLEIIFQGKRPRLWPSVKASVPGFESKREGNRRFWSMGGVVLELTSPHILWLLSGIKSWRR